MPAGRFTELRVCGSHYEESEIWVGKDAAVGAQLSVPSVRGDQVQICRPTDGRDTQPERVCQSSARTH
jgi:hypothetical protein